jgi:hypothetical protein
MPCYDSRSDYNTNEGYAYLLERFAHNSPVAEMLCTMCKLYLGSPALPELPDNVLAWWAEHQKRDKAKREAESRAKGVKLDRERALAKLTPAERKALGL